MSYSRTVRPTTRTVRPSARPSARGAGRSPRSSQYSARPGMQDQFRTTTPYQQRPAGIRAPSSSTPRRQEDDLEGGEGNPAAEGAGNSGAMGQERTMQRLLNNYLNFKKS